MIAQDFPGKDDIVRVLDQLDAPQRSRKYSNDTVLQCAFFVLRTGIAWRDLAAFQIAPTTVYNRWRHWVQCGFLTKVFEHISQLYIDRLDIKDFQQFYIDSTMVKNRNGVDCVGKNPTDRGRLGTKLSVICDYEQVPLAAKFYPANKADCTTTIETVELMRQPVKSDGRRVSVLVGDRGYISEEVATTLRCKHRMRLLTPFRRNARKKPRFSTADKELLRRRHCVENLFCRLDKFKRLFYRQDQLISLFEAMHHLAFSTIILSKLAKNTVTGLSVGKTGVSRKP